MSSASRSKRRGFTLVEALVAVVILAIGITGLMGGLGAVTNAYTSMEEKERLHRLTQEKLDELIGTRDIVTGTEGGFDGIFQGSYEWSSSIDQTGTEGLVLVTVTVRNTFSGQELSAERLAYTPPVTEGGGAGGQQP